MMNHMMRNSKNKFALLFLSFGIFFANQGCQTQTKQETFLNDSARTQQAKQLLNRSYAKSVAKEFEKDSHFAQYLKRYIAQENANLNSDDMSESLLQASRNYFYDPVFLLAVVKTESQFNPAAIGTHGEIGLMQIKPDTAEWICNKKKIKWKGSNALKDPAYNILVGATYFAYLKKSLHHQKSAHFINAYNLGITSLQRMPADEREKHPYYDRVLDNYLTIYLELKKIRGTIISKN